MDVEKLIERLYKHDKDWGEGRTQDFFQVCLDCKEAATALSTLRAENKRLNEIVCLMPTTPDSGRTVSEYDKETSMYALLDDLEAENEKLRAENSMLRTMQPVELSGESARSFELALEVSKLRADLARVTAERDSIEQDFQAFTKQWWEEDNGFPCRFCKFENSGGCEQKAKHPDDEKPCAGRWFEWRGIKEE